MDWHNYVHLSEGFTPENKRLVSNPGIINAIGWHPVAGLKDPAELMATCEYQESP